LHLNDNKLTSDDVAFFNKTPGLEFAKIGKYSHHSSDEEKGSNNVNNEEAECM